MLGAAPGVGKTFAMLEEGRRLADAGRDVVIAVVETHDRAAIATLAGGLPRLPREAQLYRGFRFNDLDLPALLDHRPDVALVDEIAHANTPGSQNHHRWQDVEAILRAGIDVVSTVNIQHIESVGDAVRQITGVTPRETIPDAVLRRADQIELIDLAPQSLRDRLAEGLVYPATQVDAALSNYFRVGNLTALRELALLWLADEVDADLQSYRQEHGIEAPWEARERIVVGLSGRSRGEILVHRGARIASRSSGGELFAVHITAADGLTGVDPAAIASQRALVETLGGSFHQVIADQIPRALVDFARGVDATQLIIGASGGHRSFRTATGLDVVRLAGDIDVHVVGQAQEQGQSTTRQLPAVGGALSVQRRVAGLAVALAGLPLLTLILLRFRGPDAISSDVLCFQLLVVIVAMVGGIWPAVFAAIAAAFCLDFFLVSPYYNIRIDQPTHLLALVVFLVIAGLVSLVVDKAARRLRDATRSAAEAETLATVASGVIGGEDATEGLVTRLRAAFGMTSVELNVGRKTMFSSAESSLANPSDLITTVRLGNDAELVLVGKPLAVSDRKILSAFASQLSATLERRRLAREAEGMAPLAAADRLRSALLAAVGHDLRRPIAAATAAITSLRSTQLTLSEDDRAELLATADESLSALATLITDLLDVSRLQEGVLGVNFETVTIEEIIGETLEELSLAPGAVTLQLRETRAVTADVTLLRRVLINLLTNALRFAPPDTTPIISASEFGDGVQLRVIDFGPGIPEEQRSEMFAAFQRLGDTDNSTGIGLGLALSKGFVEAMGGTLEAEDTPGGGLTMVIELKAAE
jgi:two-component system sensor histidine kinase KdpD